MGFDSRSLHLWTFVSFLNSIRFIYKDLFSRRSFEKTLLIGTNSVNNSDGLGTEYAVAEEHVPKIFQSKRLMNDIALLKVDGKIEYKEGDEKGSNY